MPAVEPSIAPPLTTKVLVPLPRAMLLPKDRVPAASVKVLLVPNVLAPVRINAPLPDFVRLPAPEMTPESVSAPVLTPKPGPAVVIVRSAASVTAPGNVSGALPPKLMSAPQVMMPAVVPVTEAPDVLLIVPPLRATVAAAAPRAAAELTFTVPAERTNCPVFALAPVSVSVPAPALVMPKAVALTTPPTCRVLAVTVSVRLAPRTTPPVPRFREFVPVNVKLPFQVWALLVSSACASPLVLSSVPPAMTSVPVPIAEFAEDEPPWLISNVPVALVVSPPVKVLAPPSFNVPAPVWVTE